MRRSSAPLAGLALTLALATGCGSDGATRAVGQPVEEVVASHGPASADGVDARARASRPTVTSVVLISVDGLNPEAVERLGRDGAPHLTLLLETGTGTMNARAARETTITMPNHTGMFTGRRVNAAEGGHGVRLNSEEALPETVHAAAGERVHSIFDVVHEAGGSTVVHSAKPKFHYFEKNWPESIHETVIDSDSALVRRLRKRLRTSPPTLAFLHLSDPDTVGHEQGFMGEEYLDTVRRTDQLLGQLFRTIDEAETTRDRTAVVLTSDHGGDGDNHDKRRRYGNYRVILVARGPGVARGADLYDLSPHVDPGRKQPRYGSSKPAIRNLAAGNLALQLIGLDPVPGSMPESRGLRVR